MCENSLWAFEARFHRPISISPHTEKHQPQKQPQEVLKAATTPQVGEVYFVFCVVFFSCPATPHFLQIWKARAFQIDFFNTYFCSALQSFACRPVDRLWQEHFDEIQTAFLDKI